MARTTPGFTDIYYDAYCDGYRIFYQEGAGSVRVVRRPDQHGQLIEGVLLEPSDTEYCLWSADINSWGKTNCTTPSSITGPLNGYPAYAMADDAANSTHYITSPALSTGDMSGKETVAQVMLGVGARDQVLFYVFSGGVSLIYTRVTFSTKTVTRLSGAALNSYQFELLGVLSGVTWYKITLQATNPNGAGNCFNRVYSTSATGAATYIGDGTICFYANYGGMRFDQTESSSPIITTTAAVTRTTDSSIVYDYSNILKQDSKVFDFLKPVAPTAGTSIFSITDGTESNKIYAYVDTNGYLNAEVILSSVSQGTAQIATNICTNEKKRIAVRWNSTNLDILVYDYHTQTTETDINSVLNIPLNLNTDNFLVADHIIGNSKNLGYYEQNNKKLLFY